MLTILVQPVLKFMHFVSAVVLFLLNASYNIGQTIVKLLLQVCNIIQDILSAFAIIVEELYIFLCELNDSIAAVSNYISNSANGGMNCALEAVAVFINHIAKFFVNTRLHSKLLATRFGSFIGDFLHLLKNALLLIADGVWWLITLIPRCLIYAIISVGDVVVESITSLRKCLTYTTQVIVEDFFRLTIGIVLLYVLWHNRRRLRLVIIRWIVKVIRFIWPCCLSLLIIIRSIFRRRNDQTLSIPTGTLSILRCPLPRTSDPPYNSEKILEQRCVICKDRPKCVLLLPCKHLCLCKECSDYMVFSAQIQNCPLCRKSIDNSMSVYI